MMLAGRLVLFQGSQIQILPLDAPLTGRLVSASGTLIGTSGHLLYVLAHGQIVCVDVKRGTVQSYGIQEVAGDSSQGHIQAVADGPVVYVTGPKGILLVNVRNQRKAFFSAWPEALVPKRPPAVAGERVSAEMLVSGLRGMVCGGSYVQTVHRTSGTSVHCPTARVDGGTLYTTITPGRVVALVGGAGNE
jgi:hypothetical protein